MSDEGPAPAAGPVAPPAVGDDRGPRQAYLPVGTAVAFVLVWSSGYVAGPASVEAAAPFTVLGVRFVVAALIGAAIALVLRRRFPRGRGLLLRLAVVGLAMNALQFGLMYVAFERGLGATLGALLHSLSPVLTVLLAAGLLGERVTRVQVVGFAVGVTGVVLVLGPDVSEAGGPAAVVLGALSMLALSLGTLGQRWVGSGHDPVWGATLQFAVSAPPLLVAALLAEGTHAVTDPPAFVASLAYLAVVNSIVGLLLLTRLVHAGGPSAAGSLFFLAPPVTALAAWPIFGETLDVREVTGIVVAMVGVGAATRVRGRTGAGTG